LIEFAFAAPILLMFLVGIVYFGKAFFQIQVLAFTAQEGARAAARVPNLQDSATRDFVRGFGGNGAAVNTSSIIYQSLGAASLLSNGNTGNLPAGASIKILPWDSDGTAAATVQPGTIGILVQYPFSLLINPFTQQSGTPVTAVNIPLTLDPSAPQITFPDFAMTEKATVSQEVYQQ
jgi:Flp pilus assembly protein TadG